MRIPYKDIQKIKRDAPSNCIFHLNRASMICKCEFCGQYFGKTHHRQKYCTKDCSRKALQDQKNEWKRTKWVRPKRTGTGYIDEKPKKDFKEEEKTIKKELRRLGLKR